MKPLSFVIPLLVLAISGCCNVTSPSPPASSSFCSLGTYGPACTAYCEKAAGTQFDSGPNCDVDCMDLVRQQGLGDATTCCKESINQQCQRSCTNVVNALVSKYSADVVTPEEQQDTLDGCLAECTGFYRQVGIPLDSCSVIDYATIKAMVEGQ